MLAGALNVALPYGPAVADHCILSAGLSPHHLLKTQPLTPDQRQGLLAAVQSWEKWLDDCETRAPKGYITYRRAGVIAVMCALYHAYSALKGIAVTEASRANGWVFIGEVLAMCSHGSHT